MKKPTVFVAMSGGVDSSVAALMLKRAGYNVRGVYMKEWVPPGITCESGSDQAMAARVAARLQVPFAVWDVSKDYERLVGTYMISEYCKGRTPNPDVVCNKKIKFGVFLKKALKHGADYVATGHYIKMQKSKIKNQNYNAKYKILKAADKNKDQSYFLWTLTQKQLQYCLFPIGDYTKPDVREIAKKANLPSWDKKDSQGICFIGKMDFADFLRKYLPKKQGAIVTTDGKHIGTHDGAWFYTLGQRHGIGVGGSTPYYVAKKDIKKNILVVAEEKAPELYRKELTATDVHWISGNSLRFPLPCKTRIRYRQPPQTCVVTLQKAKGVDKLKVVFLKPQRAVTPGQSIVFYKGKEMLGGGIIESRS